MNVLIIPEDFRTDQYILKPLIEAMMRAVEKPRAKVKVCSDPLLGGITEALKWERIKTIIDRYSWQVDLFLLCVDRDGNEFRKNRLNNIETLATEYLVPKPGCFLFGENAWQEIEVWALAGARLPREWSWNDIRLEVNPKEIYFEPFARNKQLSHTPGGGRKILALEAARHYDLICRRCPEDFHPLEQRIRHCLEN